MLSDQRVILHPQRVPDTPPVISHAFGQKLRELRLASGISQAALARAVHYSAAYLCKVEKGRKLPTPTLARSCDLVLGAGGALTAILTDAALTPPPRGTSAPALPDLLRTACAWASSAACADTDPAAAAVMHGCEDELRRLHPYAMAHYERLRSDGMTPLHAMRETAPLFAPVCDQHPSDRLQDRSRTAVHPGIGHRKL